MKYTSKDYGTGTLLFIILFISIIGFFISSAFVYILCWAFGIVFQWSYVIGYILIVYILRRIFSRNE